MLGASLAVRVLSRCFLYAFNLKLLVLPTQLCADYSGSTHPTVQGLCGRTMPPFLPRS